MLVESNIPTPHELTPPPEASLKSAPFAFDLGHEYALSQKYGKDYQQYFIENAHYYAKESYGRVPVSEYSHSIMEDENGDIQLVLGPDNKSARESYLLPTKDTSKPEWYRRRSMSDVTWVDSMQEALRGAEVGATFIDLSPTEFNVTARERKEWGYGDHSFARLHKVVNDNGQKKLVSRAIRNYLNESEHPILFNELTDKEAQTHELLGRVERVDPDLTPAVVRAISEGIHSSKDHKEITKSEGEMDIALLKLNAWLVTIYQMMQTNSPSDEIVKQFRGWENAIKDYVVGKNELKVFEGVTHERMKYVVAGFVNRSYEPGTNGCGLGSGFSVDRKEEAMTYESMTKAYEADCPEIKCGNKEKKCDWKASSSEVNEINAGKLTKCPKCGWKP